VSVQEIEPFEVFKKQESKQGGQQKQASFTISLNDEAGASKRNLEMP